MTQSVNAYGSDGRIFEVTREHHVVWEYISPYWRKEPLHLNMVYRAYRAPYEWVPQLERPRETSIPRLDVKTFRVPGAAAPGRSREVALRGVELAEGEDGALCVTTEDQRTPRLSAG